MYIHATKRLQYLVVLYYLLPNSQRNLCNVNLFSSVFLFLMLLALIEAVGDHDDYDYNNNDADEKGGD